MPKEKNSNIEKAKELFLSGKEPTEIGKELNIPAGTIRCWKNRYKWSRNVTTNKPATLQKKKKDGRGGPKGNRYSVGHGAPKGNKNAEKHGLFAKYLPAETLDIIESMPDDPLDILWGQIQIAYAAIIRSQNIMWVEDRDDKTIERIEERNGNVYGERCEVQQAWDKQANYLSAQARAQKTLEGMINRYEDLLHKNWEMASEEQRLRIEKIKAETAKINGNDPNEIEDDGFITALVGEVDVWEE